MEVVDNRQHLKGGVGFCPDLSGRYLHTLPDAKKWLSKNYQKLSFWVDAPGFDATSWMHRVIESRILAPMPVCKTFFVREVGKEHKKEKSPINVTDPAFERSEQGQLPR